MLTIEDVRKDLKEIQYYYSKKEYFDKASKTVEISRISEKVNKYSTAITKAPIKLLDLYFSLYLFNNTLEALAFDWDVSLSYIKKLNLKLVKYLVEILNQDLN